MTKSQRKKNNYQSQKWTLFVYRTWSTLKSLFHSSSLFFWSSLSRSFFIRSLSISLFLHLVLFSSGPFFISFSLHLILSPSRSLSSSLSSTNQLRAAAAQANTTGGAQENIDAITAAEIGGKRTRGDGVTAALRLRVGEDGVGRSGGTCISPAGFEAEELRGDIRACILI